MPPSTATTGLSSLDECDLTAISTSNLLRRSPFLLTAGAAGFTEEAVRERCDQIFQYISDEHMDDMFMEGMHAEFGTFHSKAAMQDGNLINSMLSRGLVDFVYE